MPLIDPVEWAAFAALRRHLGLWTALRLGWTLRRRVAQGAPFEALPAATTPSELESRAQLGPAVVLFRLLRERGRADARAVTGAAIEAGAVAFLQQSLGPIRRADLAAMDAAQRDAWVRDRGARFPNATVTWEHVGPDAVRFRVTDCRFVGLCHALSEPDLAPLFCAGDATYFGGVEPDVELRRPHTLAEGGPDCPFTLSWRDP